jgi:phosphoglycerol transferase
MRNVQPTFLESQTPEAQPPLTPAPHRTFSNSKWTALATYGASLLICLIVLILSLQLWRANLRIPFGYTPQGQDSFLFMMLTKTVGETGWINQNPHLGAPGILEQLDYPLPEAIHWATVKLLFLFTSDYALVFNLFYLLAFPAIALTSTYAARKLGLGPATSICIAQLYAFLPYHMLRGEMHQGLCAYYAIPLTIPLILGLSAGAQVFEFRRGGFVRSRIPGAVVALLTCVLVALSNPYYAAFTCFFLAMAACIAMRRSGNPIRFPLIDAGIMIGVIVLAVFVEITPNLIFSAEHGSNPIASAHDIGDSDVYAMKLTQLVLPVPGHRIRAFAALRSKYALEFSFINENESSALGLLGAAAFLFLLARGVTGLSRPAYAVSNINPRMRMLDDMSMLTVAAVLLGTVGGIGSTLSFLIVDVLRAYNRISLFISFFSFVTLGLAVEWMCRRWLTKHTTICEAGILLILLVLGLLDQIPPSSVPDYALLTRDFTSDQHFVESIEASLPPGAAVFQLPAMKYLVSPPVAGLEEWQLFRGYLHSRALRWSYGAMVGRPAYEWQVKALSQSLPDALQDLRDKGFAGIYLDRRGFPDLMVELALVRELGERTISEDQHIVFFRL